MRCDRNDNDRGMVARKATTTHGHVAEKSQLVLLFPSDRGGCDGGTGDHGSNGFGGEKFRRQLCGSANAVRVHVFGDGGAKASTFACKRLILAHFSQSLTPHSFFLFQLHMAALTALNTEVLELKKCLQKSEGDKEHLRGQLKEAYDERERGQRRLESIGAAHESRLTEMHCVIVELNRKLKMQQENAIMEEHEPDGSGEFGVGFEVNSDKNCF
jgi:hypothetical protein